MAEYVLKYSETDGFFYGEEATGGLEYFDEARDTDTPNATVPAHQFVAMGAESNIDIVISPKGTGAILAQVPDGTATGGNKRGQNAVDLQQTRTSASQVASGDYSMVLGGAKNTASGYGAISIGGYWNNLASGNNSFIAGGTNNTASGSTSFASGNSNTASGNGSAVVNGSTNIASGNFSFVGSSIHAKASNYGQQAHAAGRFAATGDAQQTELVYRRNITNSSGDYAYYELFLDGSSERFVLPNYSNFNLLVQIEIRRVGGSEHFVGTYLVGIKRDANAGTTAVYDVTTLQEADSGASTYVSPMITGDTTNGSLKIEVNIPSGFNCYAVAAVRSAEGFAGS